MDDSGAAQFSLIYTGLLVLWLILPSCTRFSLCTVIKKKGPFSMAVGNVKLTHESFPKHSRVRIVREIRR